MVEVVMFHHVQGLTRGVQALADRLREAGHTVHVPDLMDGRTFDSVQDGFAYLGELGGSQVFSQRAQEAAADLPGDVVYVGHSMGVMASQALAQNKPGARGAVLLYSFVSPDNFGSWPDGVPAQVHGASGDEFFAGDGDLAAAQEFTAATPGTELFVYEVDGHLFADPSTADHDEAAAARATERIVEFVNRL